MLLSVGILLVFSPFGPLPIPRNQEDFPKSAWASLKMLCRNGKLGSAAKMMLLFTFRNADGDLKIGM